MIFNRKGPLVMRYRHQDAAANIFSLDFCADQIESTKRWEIDHESC